jgi:hypothetical protein
MSKSAEFILAVPALLAIGLFVVAAAFTFVSAARKQDSTRPNSPPSPANLAGDVCHDRRPRQ